MTYKLTNFLGVNNRLPDSALHVRTRQIQGDYLKDAVNVDIDNAGRLRRRRDVALVQAMTGAHSLHMTSDAAGFLVRDSVLYAITLTTYAETIVKVLSSNAAMSYVAFNGDLYYSNGADSGRITTGVVYPLGMPTPDAPTLTVIGGGLVAATYQVAVGYANTTTGEEGGVSGKLQVELTSEGGIRVALPAATPGATHVNVYLSEANGSVVYLAATVAAGTPLVDLIALPTGREAPERRDEPLPAGRLLLSSGRLCSVVGNTLYVGIPYKPGYIDPINYGVPFPEPISVAVDAQAGIYVAADKTYWLPNEGVIADVLPYGAVPGTEFAYPDKTVVGWFGAKGFVLGTPSGEAQAVMSDNIALTTPASGTSLLIEGEYDRVVSCGWCMNLENRAVTSYTGWTMTSYSRGYGTTPTGLVTMADGGSVEWSVDFGKVDLGNDKIKHLPNAYLGVQSSNIMRLTVDDTYTYTARAFDETLNTQRIDVGKGLRGTWFGLKLTGTDGADFRLESIDFIPATTKRRI